MCEWTPPYETSPSRCTLRPRSNAAAQRGVLEERAVGDRAVDAHQVLVEPSPGADRQMADLRVAHLPGRQARGLAGRIERRVREVAPEAVEDRRVRQLDGVAGTGRRATPPVEDDERYERVAARQIARKESTSSEAPPTSAPSTSGCAEQLGGVVRLDRAAVEHRHVEQRLHEGVRLLRELRRRGLAGADRPDRLVRDDEVLVALEHRDLAAQNVLRLPRLALGLGLADARDHRQAGVERGACAPGDGLVRLAEVLPPLGVADDRAVDAELAQHRRRHLAGERAFVSQCTFCAATATSVPASTCTAVASETYGGQTTTSTSARPRVLAQLPAEVRRLLRPLVHLPVACDQHAAILRGRDRRDAREAPCPRAARAPRRRRSTPSRRGRRGPSR